MDGTAIANRYIAAWNETDSSRRAALLAETFGGILIPLRLRTPAGVLSFLSTTTVFGTPADVTVSEIAIEAFFPADDETAGRIR